MKKYVNLCGCSSCESILIDSNPQFGSNVQTEKVFLVDIKELINKNGDWFCPECNGNDLTDNLDKIAKLEKNRTKLVKLANMLDINDDDEKFTLDNIKAMLLRDDVDPSIVQFLEGCVEVPLPSGREFSNSEREKIGKYFQYYSYALRLSKEGYLYFGTLDEEYEDNPTTLTSWGYITEENLNKILKPVVKKEEVKKNKVLGELGWYKKLMKNIK